MYLDAKPSVGTGSIHSRDVLRIPFLSKNLETIDGSIARVLQPIVVVSNDLRAIRVADNLIKSYGEDKFRYLLEQFGQNTPGPKIATEFSVTKQRVSQWKRALGECRTTFHLHPEVEKRINRSSISRTTI